jgi:hypothetical protein
VQLAHKEPLVLQEQRARKDLPVTMVLPAHRVYRVTPVHKGFREQQAQQVVAAAQQGQPAKPAHRVYRVIQVHKAKPAPQARRAM